MGATYYRSYGLRRQICPRDSQLTLLPSSMILLSTSPLIFDPLKPMTGETQRNIRVSIHQFSLATCCSSFAQQRGVLQFENQVQSRMC